MRDFYRVDGPTVELIGTVCLSLFLAMALMTLRLWELVSLALPILVILSAQALLVRGPGGDRDLPRHGP